MNNILELKGRFEQIDKAKGAGGGPSMNGHVTVTLSMLEKLRLHAEQAKQFWAEEKPPFDGVLINVQYNKIAAKSNRISGLFKTNNPNECVVGAKFNDEKNKHIITYFLSSEDLDVCIDKLSEATKVLASSHFSGSINKSSFDNHAAINRIPFSSYSELSKSAFKKIIADVSYIDGFITEGQSSQPEQSIVSLYDTKTDTKKVLSDLGIEVFNSNILDNLTVFLDEKQIQKLYKKAPYLISMATENLSALSPEDFATEHQGAYVSIPSPVNEPTIGVIDTLFDSCVYFSEWVEYMDKVNNSLSKSPKDYNHGTAVSSIIVDGPKLNPWLDDGCGRFKVRHFGVALNSGFSSFTITKLIREIVSDNPDIKVWNLSLGSEKEINDNFISAEASVLDQIQHENNVVFVVAGTNSSSRDVRKIGAPADSINSIVVNAITLDKKAPQYARKGPALSFFAKPDISYYGGSKEQFINVCEPLGLAKVAGTSYAAPWIARKMSYLIDILGLKREIAKAMLIDSTRKWNPKPSFDELSLYGHGIVPISIADIVKTADDEIQFLVSDVSEKWNTYSYNFPVPLKEDSYPYVARATMCYFPKCNRRQGVDYTNTELNLRIGRLKENQDIQTINDDKQNQLDSENHYLFEGEARKQFRKWDNVKYVAERFTARVRPKKSYTKNKNWGIEVKTSNRLDPEDGKGVRFGIVVTLKAMDGKNRIDEFIRSCAFNGWLVNTIDIQERIEINQKINEDIEFT